MKFLARALVMLLMAASFGACLEAPPDPLRLGTNFWPGYEPLYLARELGYLDKSPVRLQELRSASEVLTAFRNRAIEVAALTLDEALLLLDDGADARIILIMDYSLGADAVLARPGIESPADLKGKRIGVESEALGAYMLSRTLDFAGLQAADITVVNLPVNQQVAAYEQDLVDAVVTFEPNCALLKKAGAVQIFDSSLIPGEILDVLVVHADLLESRSRELAGLQEAWFQALAYLRANPADAAARMALRTEGTAEEFLDALAGLRFPDRKENDSLLKGPQPGLLVPARSLGRVMVQAGLLDRAADPALLLPGLRTTAGSK